MGRRKKLALVNMKTLFVFCVCIATVLSLHRIPLTRFKSARRSLEDFNASVKAIKNRYKTENVLQSFTKDFPEEPRQLHGCPVLRTYRDRNPWTDIQCDLRHWVQQPLGAILQVSHLRGCLLDPQQVQQ